MNRKMAVLAILVSLAVLAGSTACGLPCLAPPVAKPTVTPAPRAEATPTTAAPPAEVETTEIPTCEGTPHATWVEDTVFADWTEVTPGERIHREALVRNTGDCPWGATFQRPLGLWGLFYEANYRALCEASDRYQVSAPVRALGSFLPLSRRRSRSC